MIVINDEFVITTDGYGYALQQKKIGQSGKGEGKERLRPIGYYTSVRNCLKALAGHWARLKYRDEDTDLPGFIKAINDKVAEYEAIVEKCEF